MPDAPHAVPGTHAQSNAGAAELRAPSCERPASPGGEHTRTWARRRQRWQRPQQPAGPPTWRERQRGVTLNHRYLCLQLEMMPPLAPAKASQVANSCSATVLQQGLGMPHVLPGEESCEARVASISRQGREGPFMPETGCTQPTRC